MTPPSQMPVLESAPSNRAAILQGLLIGTIVIAALYFGRDVLLPLALAILLSFVLTPPLLLLRRLKVPRVLAVAAGHISALADTKAKLICLSYLGLGSGPAHIRYLVRRLRRILPEGVAILVAYWSATDHAEGADTHLDMIRADAYAATLPEAVETCVKAASGKLALKSDEAKAKPRRRKAQPASA